MDKGQRKVRVCGDFRVTVNPNLVQVFYVMPSFEDKEFSQGGDVRVKNENNKDWEAEKTTADYSYEVDVGGIIKRNHADQLRQRHVRKCDGGLSQKMVQEIRGSKYLKGERVNVG